MHYLVKGHLLDWRGSFVGEKRKKTWRALLCLMWTLWKERNRIAFIFFYRKPRVNILIEKEGRKEDEESSHQKKN